MKTKTPFAQFRRFFTRIEPYFVVFLLVVLIFLGVVVSGTLPPDSATAQATLTVPTPAAQATEFSGTPIPEEYLSNDSQTNGIILGSVILVLIVIGGTLSVMLRKDNRNS